MKTWIAALALLSLVVATPAHAAKKYGPGASDTEIKLGYSVPMSGPASSYGIVGKVFEGYFKMINEQGGINGRKVTLVGYDDQYSPPRTVEVVRRMVEQDEVLAIFGTLGTACNAAIAKYLNAKKVPHLLLGTGSTRFADPKVYPWTTPYLPSYDVEARFYAKRILATVENPRIAVLYQNDDFGKDLLGSFKQGLGSRASAIVAEASYEISDPVVDSQIVQLKASGANVFVSFSLHKAGAQAIRKVYELGWRPAQQYLSHTAASVKSTLEPAGLERSVGVTSMTYYKDPSQTRWADDAAMKEYKAFMQKYAPTADLNLSSASYAYNQAWLIAHFLRTAGDDLTRENLLRVATSFKDLHPPMVLPDVFLTSTPTDRSPIKTLVPIRFNGKEFEQAGPAMAVR